MKRIVFILFLLPAVCFSIGYKFLHAQETPVKGSIYREIHTTTFSPLFRALKRGDVDTIKKYISEEMYNEYKVLLEENKDYPNFLRNFYRGAKFRRDKIVQVNNNIVANIVVKYKNGDSNLTKLQLKKGKDQVWKIEKTIMEKPIKSR